MRRRTVRQRRATAAGVLLGFLGGILLLLLAGSGHRHRPLYQARGQTSRTREVSIEHGPVSGLRQRTNTIPGRSTPPRFVAAPAAVAAAARMALADQVAALFLPSLPAGSSDVPGDLANTPWAGVVLTPPAPADVTTAQESASEAAAAIRSAGGSAPLIGIVQPGGRGNTLPGLPPEAPPRIAAIGDPAARAARARSQAAAAAAALVPLGFNMILAPAADVDVPQGALSDELFGTDPSTVAALSAAALAGYRKGGLIAAAGHFPGQGAASADPDTLTATVGGSIAALRIRDLVPFAAISAQAPIVEMSNASYAAFDGVTPAALLPQAVQLLRTQLAFNGVVMSGDLDATLQATGEDSGAVALQALQAGDDLLLISGTSHERLHAAAKVLRAARRSPAVAAMVRAALLRVLTLKAHHGLLTTSG